VVTHNEGDWLRKTVETFLSTLPAHGCEVIVVDDQSSDGSTAFLSLPEFARAQLIVTPQRLGISGARNLGGRAARAEVIVFSDAHVIAHAGWAEPLYNAAKLDFVGEVAPTVHSMHEPGICGWGFTWNAPSLKMHWLKRRGKGAYPVPFLCGCFVAMRREIFERTGGFDEGLIRWGSEDAEFSFRVWRMGYECHVVSTSAVSHLFRKKFPYEVKWEGVVHNTLRLATIHFGSRALARVVDHYRKFAAFPAAAATLADSNVWQRRELIQRESRLADSWLIDRFEIDVLR